MIRVAWIADKTDSVGGAEIVMRDLLERSPMQVTVTEYGPGVEIAGCDVAVLHNITTFDKSLIEQLEGISVVKQVHDMWTIGDTTLRNWLLNNEDVMLLFSSQMHVKKFPHQIGSEFLVTPPGMQCARYVEPESHRDKPRSHRAVWIGRMFYGKGVAKAVNWAEKTGTELDFYGWGPNVHQVPPDRYLGVLEPEEVPAVLREYDSFVFLPTMVEPFGRVAVEAHLAGCKLVVNQNVGAVEWLRGDRNAIYESCEAFWHVVQQAATRKSRDPK